MAVSSERPRLNADLRKSLQIEQHLIHHERPLLALGQVRHRSQNVSDFHAFGVLDLLYQTTIVSERALVSSHAEIHGRHRRLRGEHFEEETSRFAEAGAGLLADEERWRHPAVVVVRCPDGPGAVRGAFVE